MVETNLMQQPPFFHQVLELGGEFIVRGLDKSQFDKLALDNPELRMERAQNGEIKIMSPVKGGSGFRENRLSTDVTNWSDKVENGMVFSASTGFDLPNGATKSPDVAWICEANLEGLTEETLENEYVPIVPDFVIEVRSKTDRLKKLKEKMEDAWMAGGVRLGWLIDYANKEVWIYRKDKPVEKIQGFDKTLSGEDVLPDFIFPLSKLMPFSRRRKGVD